MIKYISLLVILLVATFTPRVEAQAPSAPALVQKPPKFISWSIRYKMKNSTPAAGGVPDAADTSFSTLTQSTYTITDGIAKVESDYTNNLSKIAYITATEEINKWSNSPKIRVRNLGEFMTYDSGCMLDFPGFEWISEKNFVGQEKMDNQPCLHYRDQGEGLVREAWVNAENRYPVAFSDGAMIATYEFRKAPSARIVIPRDFAAALEKARQ